MLRVRVATLVISLLLVTSGVAAAKLDKSAAAYKKAADSYFKLIYSPKKFPRDKWLESVKLFKKVYTDNPRGKKTPDALFMTGRIYQFMYLNFGKGPDRENAVTIFRVLVRSYPFSSLSDDALFRSGEIHTAAGDMDQAMAAYTGLLKWFPTGDMAPEAKRRLAELRAKSKRKSVAAKKLVKKKKLPVFGNVRFWSSENYARVVLDVSKKVNYRIAPRKGENGLTVDLVGTTLGKSAAKGVKPAKGPVQSVTVASLKNGIKRVTIALKHKSSYSAMELSNPPRIVFDFYSKEQQSGGLLAQKRQGTANLTVKKGKSGAATGLMKPPSALKHKGLQAAGLLSPPAVKPPTMLASLSRPKYGVKTIVIDPGHGGKDPGAVGRGRLKEKDVVLDIGKRLRKILRRSCGCRVIMTRNRDVFIPLEERTALANTVGADLFISIHVNANESRRVRGAETYFLSPSRSKTAMYTAARENMLAMKTDNQDMNDLAFILSDMKNTDKINESSRMASSIQKSLVKRVSRKYKLRDHGVKRGMFYVLRGASMPSVLVETAFITNRTEEKKLRSPAFREQIAQGIADGIKKFVGDTSVTLARR